MLNSERKLCGRGHRPPTVSRTSPSSLKYEDFMFDPSKFIHEEAERLKAICEDRSFIGHKVSLREGTTDKWRIITGIAEGHILCRCVPLFSRRFWTVRSAWDSIARNRLKWKVTWRYLWVQTGEYRLAGRRYAPSRRPFSNQRNWRKSACRSSIIF